MGRREPLKGLAATIASSHVARLPDRERRRLVRALVERNRVLAAQGLPILQNEEDLVRAAFDEFCTAVEVKALSAQVWGELSGEVGPLPAGPDMAAVDWAAARSAVSRNPGAFLDEVFNGGSEAESTGRPTAVAASSLRWKAPDLTFGNVVSLDDGFFDRQCVVYWDRRVMGKLYRTGRTGPGSSVEWSADPVLVKLYGPAVNPVEGYKRVRDAQRSLRRLHRAVDWHAELSGLHRARQRKRGPEVDK